LEPWQPTSPCLPGKCDGPCSGNRDSKLSRGGGRFHPLAPGRIFPNEKFLVGQLSGVVEPIAGVIGAVAVISMQPILPYALSFAAGAMIFVAVEEVIPESQLGKNTDIATMGSILGFALMMTLDVAFG